MVKNNVISRRWRVSSLSIVSVLVFYLFLYQFIRWGCCDGLRDSVLSKFFVFPVLFACLFFRRAAKSCDTSKSLLERPGTASMDRIWRPSSDHWVSNFIVQSMAIFFSSATNRQVSMLLPNWKNWSSVNFFPFNLLFQSLRIFRFWVPNFWLIDFFSCFVSLMFPAAMNLICDLNLYRKCAETFGNPMVTKAFDVLHALCNLLIVPHENLAVICSQDQLVSSISAPEGFSWELSVSVSPNLNISDCVSTFELF